MSGDERKEAFSDKGLSARLSNIFSRSTTSTRTAIFPYAASRNWIALDGLSASVMVLEAAATWRPSESMG